MTLLWVPWCPLVSHPRLEGNLLDPIPPVAVHESLGYFLLRAPEHNQGVVLVGGGQQWAPEVCCPQGPQGPWGAQGKGWDPC